MLSGIKLGKKKKKKKVNEDNNNESLTFSHSRLSNDAAAVRKSPPTTTTVNNHSAADEIKRQLAAGLVPSTDQTSSSTTTQSPGGTSNTQSSRTAVDNLERMGRIKSAAGAEKDREQDDRVVLMGEGKFPSSSLKRPPGGPMMDPEDYRQGARKGKVKRSKQMKLNANDDENKSIQDMLREELTNRKSMDEVYARNVARVGSRYRGAELKNHSKAGADEEDHMDMTMYTSQNNLTPAARQQREQSRQLAQLDQQQRLKSKCWWWMESPSFARHTMIALGNHVHLSMAPAHLSLEAGQQFYIVPLTAVESLAGCDSSDVWKEIRRFQRSLQDLFKQEGKSVLFAETVLPTSSRQHFWQTKMECFVIPSDNDAKIFFQSSMMDLTEEWGTHSHKLIPITPQRPLQMAVPKNFPYFYIEFEDGSGYAQILEGNNGDNDQKFPRDFAADTIGGMTGQDPLRMRRRKQRQGPEEERQMILKFLAKWKRFDWTLELDG